MAEAASLPSSSNNMREEETAQTSVLQKQMLDLLGVEEDFHELCKHLSISNAWENLAGHLGLTPNQVSQYSSMLPTNPGSLPAKTFFGCYFSDTGCTFLNFMRALLEMGEKDERCKELAANLWTNALVRNSSYYRERHRHQ